MNRRIVLIDRNETPNYLAYYGCGLGNEIYTLQEIEGWTEEQITSVLGMLGICNIVELSINSSLLICIGIVLFIASFAPIHQYEPLVIISKHFKMPKKEIVREKHNIYQELFVQLIVGILILIVEYSVFARGVGNDGDIYDVNIKNNYIGVAASFGAAYPDIDPDANFENTQGTDFLYISSVYKENGKTYFTVTNDTARERKLKIITSSGSYDFTVSACPEGRKYEGGFTCSLADFPIDLSYDIPEECAYAVCLDVTDERNVKQIRFVNYTGSPVYIDKSLLGTGYNSEVVLAEGPFGDNLFYNFLDFI